MKIKVEFDITPQELRESLGLPDVQPLHDEVMQQIRDKIIENVQHYDPSSFLSAYSNDGMRTLQGLQQTFWNSFNNPQKRDSED